MSAIYPNYPFRAVLGLPITGFAVYAYKGSLTKLLE